jgi:hypothetical protein
MGLDCIVRGTYDSKAQLVGTMHLECRDNKVGTTSRYGVPVRPSDGMG